jgi:hypothetical protein
MSDLELDPDDWEPHEVGDFPPEMRRTVEFLNLFDAAFYGGQIPTGPWRSLGPDYELEQAVITIFPDDADFRRAVAVAMPDGSYRIEVSNVQGYAL